MLIVLPFIAVQNLAFLMTLSFVAAYLQSIVVVAVASVIIVNLIAVKIYLKFQPTPDDQGQYYKTFFARTEVAIN